MASKFVLVITIAVIAALSLNIGKAVQKMKVEVLKTGKKMFHENRRDFLIWVVGISLTFVAGILFMIAQNMTDKTSIVTSMNGVGLIGLAIFSYFVLKEKVGAREWGAVLLIILGTVMVIVFKKYAGQERNVSMSALVWASVASMGVFFVFTLIAIKMKAGRALILAAIAGSFLGLMHIFYHVGPPIKFAGGDFFEQVKPSLLYIFIGFNLGNGGFIYTNWAFFHGTGIQVVPTVNSFMMISPMVYEVIVFKATLTPLQYVGAAVIIIGVILLTTGSQAVEKSAAPGKAAAA